MVVEVERYKEEDEKQCQKILVRNSLENYVYSVKQLIVDLKVENKFSFVDVEMVKSKVKEVIDWLDRNLQVDKEEYEEREKDL